MLLNIKRRFHFHVATHVICTWSFKLLITSLHQMFFKPIRIFAVDINCYLNLYQLRHFVPIILWYSGGWIANWLQKIYPGNKSRARKRNDEISILNSRERSWLKKSSPDRFSECSNSLRYHWIFKLLVAT